MSELYNKINVCLNRVFNKFYVKFVSWGLMQTLAFAKKCAMKIERKKQRKKDKNETP